MGEGSSMVQAMVLAKSQTITIFSDVRTRAFGTDSARTHQTFFADFETPTPKSNEFPLLPAFSTLRISVAFERSKLTFTTRSLALLEPRILDLMHIWN